MAMARARARLWGQQRLHLLPRCSPAPHQGACAQRWHSASNEASVGSSGGRKKCASIDDNSPHHRQSAHTQQKSLGERLDEIRQSISGQKMKELAKRYGPIAFVFHTSVYVTTLSAFYYGVGHGVDISSILSKIPFVEMDRLDPTAGQFAAAYAAAMITGPVRAVLTMTATPHVARVWRNHVRARPAPLIAHLREKREVGNTKKDDSQQS